jgi:hypothetical protein
MEKSTNPVILTKMSLLLQSLQWKYFTLPTGQDNATFKNKEFCFSLQFTRPCSAEQFHMTDRVAEPLTTQVPITRFACCNMQSSSIWQSCGTSDNPCPNYKIYMLQHAEKVHMTGRVAEPLTTHVPITRFACCNIQLQCPKNEVRTSSHECVGLRKYMKGKDQMFSQLKAENSKMDWIPNWETSKQF